MINDNNNIEIQELIDVNEDEYEDESMWNEYQSLHQDDIIEVPKRRKIYEVPEHLNLDLPEEEREKLKKDFKYDHSDRDNPYRKDSSVKLSKEIKNFRRIETNVLLNLINSGLSGREFSVVLYIIHRTRGYNKHVVKMLIKDIQDYTDISRKYIYTILENLMRKQIIYEVPDDDPNNTKKKINDDKNKHTFGVNFYYDTWKLN